VSTRPCPHCGNVVDAQARFCGQCGNTIQAPLTKTLLDENPFGASATPAPPNEPLHKPAAKTLMQTLADPDAEANAKELLAAALQKEEDKSQTTPDARPIAGSKTMLLGGEPLVQTAPLASSTTAPHESPLSRSIMTPGSSAVPTAPNPQVAAALAASPAASPSNPGPMTGAGGMKTMLGMPATALPSSSKLAAAPPQAPPPAPSDSGPSSQQLPPSMKTMLGVAIPGIAPTGASTAPQDPQQQALNVNKPAGTLLGVAIPGIAPSHPSSTKQAAAPLYAQQNSGTNLGMGAVPMQSSAAPNAPNAQHAPNHGLRTLALPQAPPPILPAPAPLVDEPLPEAPRLPEKKGVPVVAVVGIVFLLVAIAGGAAAFFVVRGGTALTAQPQLDENGKESLKIKCESCPDGTKIALGASSTEIAAGTAILPLPAPLKIGDNDLDISIDRPTGRDETVRIHVPVAYRVRADMATLSAKPPAITVRVEATSGSDVTVEGKPVTLDATGRGSYAIDLSSEVEGPSDESKTVEKKIAFTITAKGTKPESGSLVARAAIVPLHVDSPGSVLYTERSTAAVSGQTKAGGTVTIDGAVSPIDAQGRFGARVELKEMGEKTLEIVASAPPLAPRIARAKVIRVASLEATAKDLESKGPLAYDAFASDAANKIGQAVAVDGDVVESRAQQGYTVMLVDAKKCPGGKGACLVRIVHGEEMKASRGDTVRAYGVIEGVVSASGKQVPDIEASLLVAKGPGTK
jgi:hypothetical protein